MTSQLASTLDPIKSIDPSQRSVFFTPAEEDYLKNIISIRECPDHTKFPPDCNLGLFLSVFFDGTNNNLSRDEKSHGHSNVARLYRAFPKSGVVASLNAPSMPAAFDTSKARWIK